MTLGNEDIARFIELGARTEGVFKTTIINREGKEVPIELKWRPVKEHEYNMAVSNSFDYIPEHAVKWLLAKKEERVKMKEKGLSVPSSHVRLFDHWFDVNVIFQAMQDFYPSITVEQVSKLAINFTEFAKVITTASGNKDGQETVATFPANGSEQQPESKAE